jgi:hypothetical protein
MKFKLLKAWTNINITILMWLMAFTLAEKKGVKSLAGVIVIRELYCQSYREMYWAYVNEGVVDSKSHLELIDAYFNNLH